MIRVARIQGESFDLDTGDHIPKGLILSNGVRELCVHVDDAVAGEILKMLVEYSEAQSETPSVEVSVPPGIHTPVEQAFPTDTVEETFGTVHMEEELEEDDDEFEPGEEYNDPMTGIGSM